MKAIPVAICGDANKYSLQSGTSVTKFVIERASEDDSMDAIVATEKLIVALTGTLPTASPKMIEEAFLKLVRAPDSSFMLFARDAESRKLVGFVSVSFITALRTAGMYGLIQELWVDHRSRKQGVAGNLLKSCASYARAAGASQLEVGLPRYEYYNLENVKNVYVRNGFSPVGPRFIHNLTD